MEGIDIQIDLVGGLHDIALLKIKGFVDTTTAPQLHKILIDQIHEGLSQFIIDLGAVQYVSSAGWGVFVGEIRNLRERGGDLKLSQMAPEVFEVFDMLEFNRILMCYDSIEEAIDDFDFCRGLDLKNGSNFTFPQTKPIAQASWHNDVAVMPAAKPVAFSSHPEISRLEPKQQPVRKSVDDAELPLTEKIKKLVLENPKLGAWSIKRLLYSPRFGYTKVGFYKLRSILKKLALDTKAKRYRYFRSR